LVSPDWRDNMVLITRTQALIAGTAMVLVDAADAAGNSIPHRVWFPRSAEPARRGATSAADGTT
jgi:hypothetical protein